MANDLWRTPPEVIEFVERRYGDICIDLCCSGKDNAIRPLHITESDDFLNDKWIHAAMVYPGDHCWLNPPYSKPRPFVEQAIKWSEHGYAVTMLLNCDTSTKWYELIERHAAVISPIVGGRIHFLNSEGVPIRSNNKPQLICHFAPFGRSAKAAAYEPIHISEIYTDE